MIQPRIIPCLLISDNKLIKTVNFKNPAYIGDPINAVKIFNEKEVDEIIILDISATRLKQSPNFELISNISGECEMPFCYGGGINNLDDALKIFSFGVEKISLNSALYFDPHLIKSISKSVGEQSVVASIDIEKNLFGKYKACIKNGNKKIHIDIIDYLKKIHEMGVGEILLNNINNDGKMKGFDLNIILELSKHIHTPYTILGGAGNIINFKEAILKLGLVGISAGSFFIYKGPHKAVLLNYPKKEILTLC